MSRAQKPVPKTANQATPTAGPQIVPGTTGSITITATHAQNEFGHVLEQATRNNVVVITRHNAPRAVLVSIERYRELTGVESTMLNVLTNEFDAMLARMQTPAVRSGIEQGFRASAAQMKRTAAAVRGTTRPKR